MHAYAYECNRGRVDQRGRKVANEFMMKSLLILDAVKLRRTDGGNVAGWAGADHDHIECLGHFSGEDLVVRCGNVVCHPLL